MEQAKMNRTFWFAENEKIWIDRKCLILMFCLPCNSKYVLFKISVIVPSGHMSQDKLSTYQSNHLKRSAVN